MGTPVAIGGAAGTGSGGGFGILKANFLSEAGGFHAEEAALTPAVGGEIFDEAFFDGGAGFEFFAEGVEERGETGRVFTLNDDGFGEHAVGGAAADGAAGFGTVDSGGLGVEFGSHGHIVDYEIGC